MPKPNVLFLVMDCASKVDFDKIRRDSWGLGDLEGFLARAVEFKRAVAPASWTLPSHASMFSGAPPWIHGFTRFARGSFPSDLRTVASQLTTAGYNTASVSANPVISPQFGVTDGFRSAKWGRFSDVYLRGLGISTPPGSWRASPSGEPDQWFGSHKRRLLSVGRRIADGVVTEAPWMFELGSRAGAAMLHGTGRAAPYVCPWIESTIEGGYRQDSARPLFLFVNLLDAHEPYVGVPPEPGESQTSLITALTAGARLKKSNLPAPDDVNERLHRLYQRTLSFAMRRAGSIIRRFLQLSGDDDSMVVLTSDHGQSFAHGESLYHGVGTDDSLLRVPLFVKLPQAAQSDVTLFPERWTTTTLIHDIIADSTHIGQVPGSDTGLTNSMSEDRPFAVSASASVAAFHGGGQSGEPPEPVLVLYSEDAKSTVGIRSGQIRSWTADDPSRQIETPGFMARLVEGVRSRMGQRSEALGRLATWGYE